MSNDSNLKRWSRAWMSVTGEKYMTARRAVLAQVEAARKEATGRMTETGQTFHQAMYDIVLERAAASIDAPVPLEGDGELDDLPPLVEGPPPPTASGDGLDPMFLPPRRDE